MSILNMIFLAGLSFQVAWAHPVLESQKIKIRKNVTFVEGRKTIQWYSGPKLLLQQEYSLGGELLVEKSDTNQDGFFDQHKKFFSNEKKLVQVDFDSWSKLKKFETTLRHNSKDRLKRTVSEYNSKGQKLTEFTSILSRKEILSSQQGLCDAQGNSLIFQKVKALQPLIAKLNIVSEDERYLVTNFGAHIEKKCLEQWGDDFPVLVQQSLKENLNCLAELQGKGPELNIAKIASILENKEKPWKIICSESLESDALASIPGVDKDHPWVKLSADKGGIPSAGLKYMIFHELLHNRGHTHDVGSVEYMYACPRCCDDKKDAVACRICRGNYSSAQDLMYITDYAQLGFIPGQGARLLSELLAMPSERRKNHWALYLKHLSMAKFEGYESLYQQVYQAFEKAPGIKQIKNLDLEVPKRSSVQTFEAKNLIEALRQIDNPAVAFTALEKNLKSMKDSGMQDAVSFHTLTVMEHIKTRLDPAKKEDAAVLKRHKSVQRTLGLEVEE